MPKGRYKRRGAGTAANLVGGNTRNSNLIQELGDIAEHANRLMQALGGRTAGAARTSASARRAQRKTQRLAT